MTYDEAIKELENGSILQRDTTTKADGTGVPYSIKKENKKYYIKARFNWNISSSTRIKAMLQNNEWRVKKDENDR